MLKTFLAAVALIAAASPAWASSDLLGHAQQLASVERSYSPIPHARSSGETREARSGCCSHHGGVAGCDTATGHQACGDGSDSPSCLCGE